MVIVGLLVIGARYLPINGAPLATPAQDIARLQGQSVALPDPKLTAQGLAHITVGDNRGGGHLYGRGIPCKSEFPATWTSAKIARDIPLLAANDNLDWQQSSHGNGYVVAESSTPDGLDVRIVVNPRTNEIVTAYPTNVRRNPCRGANDNW